MRALRLISWMTLAFVAADGAASPVWPARRAPAPQVFQDCSQLDARIVADRGILRSAMIGR